MKVLIWGLAVSLVLLAMLAITSVNARSALASPWVQSSATCVLLDSHWIGSEGYTAQNSNTGDFKCFKSGAGPAP